MASFNEDWFDRRRSRFVRPDAHRYWRPDAARWLTPEAQRLLLPPELRRDAGGPSHERKYSPDQPRVPAGNPDGGQWTANDATVESILALVRRVAAAGSSLSYQRCLDICYPLLERAKPPGSDRNTWDFIKCMNRCLGRN